MIFGPIMDEALALGFQAKEVTDVSVVVRDWVLQQHFEDTSVNAALDFSRSIARAIIVLAVVGILPAYWVFMMIQLASSGADPRRLERVRNTFWRLVQGLAGLVCAYIVLNFSVTLAILLSGFTDIVLFWDPMIFGTGDFSLDTILGGEVAVAGEILLVDGGGNPIICETPLDMLASDVGWVYVPDLEGTGVSGCER